MILPTILFFGALGYFFYTTKKEIVLDDDTPIENSKVNNDLHEDLEDLFI